MAGGAAASWEHFWSASAAVPAYARNGRSHPALDEAWLHFFADVGAQLTAPLKAIDLACGSGVLVGYLHRAFGRGDVEIHCLDASPAAIASIRQRFPAVVGHVADARETRLGDAAYDIVTSQFGIEYAGIAAFHEAMRLVKQGGFIGLLIHCKDGRIERDGREAHDAVTRVLQSGLMDNATRFFAAAFAYQVGRQGLAQLQQCAAALQHSLDVSLGVVHQYGPAIANGTIARLLADIGAMANELRGCDENETMRWLRAMHAELTTYAARMHALCEAAFTTARIDEVAALLAARGFEVLQCGLVGQTEGAGALAWFLHGYRR